MKPRILLAGGGTGGHLFPALAVAEALTERGADVHFAGTRNGIEARIIPSKGYQIHYLWLSGFNRRKVLSNLLLPLKIIWSMVQSLGIIGRVKPAAALGTGGYVCGPILAAAILRGVPVYLQEQNSFPGVTTRLLARFARKVYLNFEEAAVHFTKEANCEHVGNPVRPGIMVLNRDAAIKKWDLNPNLPTLLVFGGSQGAMSINQAVAKSLPDLGAICNLIWGRGQIDRAQPQGWQGPGQLVVEPFIEDMSSAYAAADLAVCRSGAMTLSELSAARVPAILIPYPYAAGDHQKHNALAYCRKGGAVLLENKDLKAEVLLAMVTGLLNDRVRLDGMKDALKTTSISNAADIIADALMTTVKNQ